MVVVLSGFVVANQHVDGVGADFLNGIAALHHVHGRQSEGTDPSAIGGEVVRGQFERTDRVGLESVHTERHDECVGVEGADLRQGVVQRFEPSVERGARRQRVVRVVTLACSDARLVGVTEKVGEFVGRVCLLYTSDAADE